MDPRWAIWMDFVLNIGGCCTQISSRFFGWVVRKGGFLGNPDRSEVEECYGWALGGIGVHRGAQRCQNYG